MRFRLAPAWKRIYVLLATAAVLVAVAGGAVAQAPVLDARTLTKYMDPLPIPGPMPMAGPDYYEIGAYEIHQQLHSQLPPTYLFGYGASQATASYPAATIMATRGVPIDIRWTNNLGTNHPLSFAFDPTIEHAQTTTGVPITTHVHGAEVEPESDGGPLTWFTPGGAEVGEDWVKPVNRYVNTQLASTIWYHDHAFGYTRHNVYAGLAGYYIISDPGNEPAGLPSGAYEVPLCFQDKMFTTDGQLWYPNVGLNPEHPVWIPEFFGDAILVNGKVWPYLEVEPRKYRFRMLNGAQARFFSLALADRVTGAPGPRFHQIGTDGGYLAEPVVLNDPAALNSPRLLLAPGERADVIIDFSGYAPGTELLLRNSARAPYPNGTAPNGQSTAQVMLIRIVPSTGPDDSVIPAFLTNLTRLGPPSVTKTMTLNEIMGAGGPLGMVLNGTPFMGSVVERPTLGTTEMWEIVNMTADTHPIHLHLVQFQLLNRQKVDMKKYGKAFDQANPVLPADTYNPVAVGPYLKGKPVPADPNERGWKDTFRMNPGEVTRILVKWAPQDDSQSEFAFDATAEPGYVWHCHILEHEENDMMHRFQLVAPTAPVAAQIQASELAEALPRATAVTRLRTPYPNPSSRGATMRFSLAVPGPVELDLYSVAGQRVRKLASATFAMGEHALAWDGNDDGGRPAAPGVYFVRMRANGASHGVKMLVTR